MCTGTISTDSCITILDNGKPYHGILGERHWDFFKHKINEVLDNNRDQKFRSLKSLDPDVENPKQINLGCEDSLQFFHSHGVSIRGV